MAADTIAFLETVVGGPAFLLGYSDGAIVALLTAMRRPDLVRRLVFAAAVFHRDGWADGVLDNDAAPPEFLRDSYAEISPDGREHFDATAPVIVTPCRRSSNRCPGGPRLRPHVSRAARRSAWGG